MKLAKSTTATLSPKMAARLATAPWLAGDPEWEAVKCTTRNLSAAAAIEECEELTQLYRELWTPMAVNVTLDDIVDALQAKRIPFVLSGAHGFSVWTGRPRATKDVDLLVKHGRNYMRAVEVVKELYPNLEVRRFGTLTAFFLRGKTESVIDISYPLRPDNEQTLRTAIWTKRGSLRLRIPDLEPALANKYGAMLALGREPAKRAQDMVDFMWMVAHSLTSRRKIHLKKLEALGEMVWPGGGGREILRLVAEAKAGKVPALD